MTHENRKSEEMSCFEVSPVACPGNKKLQFLVKKVGFLSALKINNFWSSKPCIRIRIDP
jgi:hypothetical protein